MTLSLRRVGLAVAVATFLFGSIAAYEASAAPTPQIINIGNGGEIKDLDPQTATGIPEFHILQNIFEPLVSKDPNLKPIPGVAESWTVSKDGKVYTFKLRKNAKWTNGESVTAQDFINSWTRLLTPKTASEYVQMGFFFKNGKEFSEGKKKASDLGLKAPDPYTLVVTLENPTPFFLDLLYHHSYYPTHKATVEKHGLRWTRPENIVTNGAFKLKSWEMNKIINLVKNPLYWDKDHVTLTEANFYPIEKTDTEEKMFRSGNLHVTNEIPLEKIPYWQKDKSGVYQQHPYLGNYFYWFNTTKPPLNNLLVRKALNLGFDRERLVKFVTRGGQLPAETFTPPGTAGYHPTPRLPKNLSRLKEAKELLAKAGYPDGKGLPPIEILYNTSDSHKKIAEALQEMWKQNLGVQVKLFNQEWKVYLDSIRTMNFQLGRQGWIGDYNDPSTFVDMLITGNPLNRAGYSNPKYDAELAAAAKEMDQGKRFEHFQNAEDILLTDLPVIPIYIYTRVYLRSKAVDGWYDNIQDIHPLKYVSISSKK